MTRWDVLPRAFYDRNPVTVAQALLGKQLVREADDGLVTGIIVETEAYLAADDPASHAYSKRRQCYRRTPRCAPMFGPPGHAYIYRSYGLHYCCNLVTEGEGVPSAVLLRAIQPERSLDVIQRRRGTDRLATLTHGPGNLCRAFAIDLALNGWDVTQGQRLWVAAPASAAALQITRSRRIGVADDLALRFAVVSRWSGPFGRRANGVLDSTTNFIVHPELVAQRLVRYAEVVGKENVIAGSDCGFTTFARTTFQVEPEIVWAKLRAMAEGV